MTNQENEVSRKGDLQIGIDHPNRIPPGMIGTYCLDLLVGEPLGSVSTDTPAGQISRWIVPTRAISRPYQDDISLAKRCVLLPTDGFQILTRDGLVSFDPVDPTISSDIEQHTPTDHWCDG